jgi:hypothetical protein
MTTTHYSSDDTALLIVDPYNDFKTILLWNKIQHKVKQEMGESSWHELMQNLGQLLKVTDQLITHHN